jgi:hypothetical protein
MSNGPLASVTDRTITGGDDVVRDGDGVGVLTDELGRGSTTDVDEPGTVGVEVDVADRLRLADRDDVALRLGRCDAVVDATVDDDGTRSVGKPGVDSPELDALSLGAGSPTPAVCEPRCCSSKMAVAVTSTQVIRTNAASRQEPICPADDS